MWISYEDTKEEVGNHFGWAAAQGLIDGSPRGQPQLLYFRDGFDVEPGVEQGVEVVLEADALGDGDEVGGGRRAVPEPLDVVTEDVEELVVADQDAKGVEGQRAPLV